MTDLLFGQKICLIPYTFLLRKNTAWQSTANGLSLKVPFQEWPYPHYSETMAWKAGLSVAGERGIHFSSKALKWASEQLATYFREGEDGSPPCHLQQAQKEAGLPYRESTS